MRHACSIPVTLSLLSLSTSTTYFSVTATPYRPGDPLAAQASFNESPQTAHFVQAFGLPPDFGMGGPEMGGPGGMAGPGASFGNDRDEEDDGFSGAFGGFGGERCSRGL